MRRRRLDRDMPRQVDIRWAIRNAISASERRELIEVATRNDVRI